MLTNKNNHKRLLLVDQLLVPFFFFGLFTVTILSIILLLSSTISSVFFKQVPFIDSFAFSFVSDRQQWSHVAKVQRLICRLMSIICATIFHISSCSQYGSRSRLTDHHVLKVAKVVRRLQG